MSARALIAVLLSAVTRYGFPPPGITSSSPVVFPCAIDGEFHASTVTKANDVAFRTSILPIFVGAGTCNTAAADVYVNATTTTNDSVNPFPCAIDGDCHASTARANDVVLRTSTLPIFVGAGTCNGRPPDPGWIPTLNTSIARLHRPHRSEAARLLAHRIRLPQLMPLMAPLCRISGSSTSVRRR